MSERILSEEKNRKEPKKRKTRNLDKAAVIMLVVFYLPMAIIDFISFTQARVGSILQIFQVEIPGKEVVWGFGNIK